MNPIVKMCFITIAIICIVFTGCNKEPGDLPDVSEPIISSKGATPSSITVPAVTSITLNCTAISADGLAVKSILWSVESAPAGANPVIADTSLAVTGVTGMTVAGEYKFKLVATGNNNVKKTEYVTVNAGLYAEVGFVELAASFPDALFIDFSPMETLPAGVTYKIADSRDPQNSWDSTDWDSREVFVGRITAEHYYSTGGNTTFTQTFYLNDTKITGSERTVTVNVATLGGRRFGSFGSDSGSVTLQYNP